MLKKQKEIAHMTQTQLQRVYELARKIGIKTMADLERFKRDFCLENSSIEELINALEQELEQGGETPCQE